MMFLTGRLNSLRLFVYAIGQFLGAFLGALIVFLVYYDGIKHYKAGMYSLDTAGIFATYPNATLSITGAFIDQVIATVLLLLVVSAMSDPINSTIAGGVGPLLIGFTVTVLNLAFSYNAGCAMNPTRDLAPRFFTFLAGWGAQTFTAGHYFFWIPIVGPLVSSVLATVIYTAFISAHSIGLGDNLAKTKKKSKKKLNL